MALTWTNEGSEAFCKMVTGNTAVTIEWYVHLSSVSYTPTPTDTWAGLPYTELVYSGYTATALTGLSWTFTPGSPAAQTTTGAYTGVSWTFPVGAGATVFQYYIELVLGAGGPFLLGGETLSPTYSIPTGGGTLTLSPINCVIGNYLDV